VGIKLEEPPEGLIKAYENKDLVRVRSKGSSTSIEGRARGAKEEKAC
jgi:hypothetical protein